MSVMVIGKERFDRIYKGLVMRGMSKEKCERLIQCLEKENIDTFNRRYNDNLDLVTYEAPSDFELGGILPVVVHQLISDLGAVRYNIDDESIIEEITKTIEAFEKSTEFMLFTRFEKYIVH